MADVVEIRSVNVKNFPSFCGNIFDDHNMLRVLENAATPSLDARRR